MTVQEQAATKNWQAPPWKRFKLVRPFSEVVQDCFLVDESHHRAGEQKGGDETGQDMGRPRNP